MGRPRSSRCVSDLRDWDPNRPTLVEDATAVGRQAVDARSAPPATFEVTSMQKARRQAWQLPVRAGTMALDAARRSLSRPIASVDAYAAM